MIPGTTTKLSESTVSLTATVSVTTDMIRITDTTTTTVLATLTPNFGGGFSGLVFLINDSGNNVTTVTTGNIEVARTVPDNMLMPLVFSKLSGKWYPGAIS